MKRFYDEKSLLRDRRSTKRVLSILAAINGVHFDLHPLQLEGDPADHEENESGDSGGWSLDRGHLVCGGVQEW